MKEPIMNYRLDLAIRFANGAMGLLYDKGLRQLKQNNKEAALAILALMSEIDVSTAPLIRARRALNDGGTDAEDIVAHVVTVEACLLKGDCFPRKGELRELIIKLRKELKMPTLESFMDLPVRKKKGVFQKGYYSGKKGSSLKLIR